MKTPTIVTWLWNEGFRDYRPEHVNSLAAMIHRHCGPAIEVVCIADEREGLSDEVRWFETPAAAREVGRLRSPEGARFPSCYRRLWMFSEEARALGDRVMLIDLDLVVCRDLVGLFSLTADFVGWRPRASWGNVGRVGGGLYALNTGSRRHVWDSFDGAPSIAEARRANFRGSDQAWISYKLGTGEAYWPDTAGIYSIRDLKDGRLPLPADAALVQFNGPQKPWNSPLPWVREHWR